MRLEEPWDEWYMEVKRRLKIIRIDKKEGLAGRTEEKNKRLTDMFDLGDE